MAFHGIVECLYSKDRRFGGVTCTDGGGCIREGRYSEYSREEMVETRRMEQRSAAILGNYELMIQLDHRSDALKGDRAPLRGDLSTILDLARPTHIYTHSPADKHASHVTVFLATLEALRSLPGDYRPELFVGCEGWRNLDWLPDGDKVALDVSGHDQLARALIGCFDSQLASGKRYDAAALGRRAANATFSDPVSADDFEQAIFAMDLMPLLLSPGLDPFSHVESLIDKLKEEIRTALKGS